MRKEDTFLFGTWVKDMNLAIFTDKEFLSLIDATMVQTGCKYV